MTDLLSPNPPLPDSAPPDPTLETPPPPSVSGTYPSYLPAVLQQDQALAPFLRAFEQVLTGGLGDPNRLGLEEMIDRVHTYLSPLAPEGSSNLQAPQAPEAFLPWLASWVTLSLRDDWSEATKRGFISRMVPLYRKRGTKEGLKELLELYVNEGQATPDGKTNTVEIYEFEQPAHYFQVTLKLPDRSNLERKRAIARAILDQEKPAHTFYALRLLFDTMRLGDDKNPPRLRLGVNTLLGTEFLKESPNPTPPLGDRP